MSEALSDPLICSGRAVHSHAGMGPSLHASANFVAITTFPLKGFQGLADQFLIWSERTPSQRGMDSRPEQIKRVAEASLKQVRSRRIT